VGAQLAAAASTIGAALVLAVLGGLVRLALLVRDTAQETKSLTAAVAELRKDHSDDHDRLTAVCEALADHRGGRHREGRTYGYW
jgi:hypothetical protein